MGMSLSQMSHHFESIPTHIQSQENQNVKIYGKLLKLHISLLYFSEYFLIINLLNQDLKYVCKWKTSSIVLVRNIILRF